MCISVIYVFDIGSGSNNGPLRHKTVAVLGLYYNSLYYNSRYSGQVEPDRGARSDKISINRMLCLNFLVITMSRSTHIVIVQ